jgi:hypothetical protein
MLGPRIWQYTSLSAQERWDMDRWSAEFLNGIEAQVAPDHVRADGYEILTVASLP